MLNRQSPTRDARWLIIASALLAGTILIIMDSTHVRRRLPTWPTLPECKKNMTYYHRSAKHSNLPAFVNLTLPTAAEIKKARSEGKTESTEQFKFLMVTRNCPQEQDKWDKTLRTDGIDGHMHANYLDKILSHEEVYQIVPVRNEEGELEFDIAKAKSVNKVLRVPPSSNRFITPRKSVKSKPDSTIVAGKWADQKSRENVKADSGANILGDNEVYCIKADKIVIPNVLATDANLAYYNAKLIKQNEGFRFEFPSEMSYDRCLNKSCTCNTTETYRATDHMKRGFPLFDMEVGKHYPEKYLKKVGTGYGGGCYLEYHDLPHFHMLRDVTAGGNLILGKFVDDGKCSKESTEACQKAHKTGAGKCSACDADWMIDHSKGVEVTAFQIPFGCGIYTPPGAIHCDSFLNGRLKVMYSNANHAETCILLKTSRCHVCESTDLDGGKCKTHPTAQIDQSPVDVQVPNHCGIAGCEKDGVHTCMK